MTVQVPLGRAEDLHLELQSAEALERPEIIGREVVGMLNAEGGEVWIGLREENGVAVEIQPIAKADLAADALLDSLVDRLEPSPRSEEVRVEVVPAGEGMSVLRIKVGKGERRPYALLKSGGRHFHLRVGRRLRPMSREELIAEASQSGSKREGQTTKARSRLRVAREAARKTAKEVMWLRLEPVGEMRLDVRSLPVEDWLFDPTQTGNRRSGWHFVEASSPPKPVGESIIWESGEALRVEITAHGAMSFRTSLRNLHFGGEDCEIWPLALLEYPISAFRLARAVYRSHELSPRMDVFADLAFFDLRGWKLRPGSVLGMHFLRRLNEPHEYRGDEADLTWPEPLVFRLDEVRETPDRCGYRLIRRVYEAFGHREALVPAEFDRETGRLVLPE